RETIRATTAEVVLVQARVDVQAIDPPRILAILAIVEPGGPVVELNLADLHHDAARGRCLGGPGSLRRRGPQAEAGGTGETGAQKGAAAGLARRGLITPDHHGWKTPPDGFDAEDARCRGECQGLPLAEAYSITSRRGNQ